MEILSKWKKLIQKISSISCRIKGKIISILPNGLKLSALAGQILIAFLGVFGIATIAFIITARYLSLETLNSYFSLLSSLTTIFAALIAIFITQDFRKQKRAELLSKFSKEKSETIFWIYDQLFTISQAIELNCHVLDEKNIEDYNFESLSEKLQNINNDQ
ncbi:unnamed protein product [Commensalibacter communis]|uniref:hypothetical protein n=1 Tax=Commensalibacter communis TaxID=2972786 RepID=UPI0022FF92D2|nr:hypothetical protein [Commensalibacter communis]CAI3926498.1 unnamed protein product [Commensalibacter communis]CAI3932646.1 unnamed protein product [Commensalibacter communis]